MGKRPKVGIPFSYNENWIGGTYYIINLVRALKTLPKSDMPELFFLITNDKERTELENIKYPFSHYLFYKQNKKESLKKILNRIFFYKKLFSTESKLRRIEIVFPNRINDPRLKNATKIEWIPDFQEIYLPHFFSEEELEGRKKDNNNIATNGSHIVFSSNNAKEDFDKLYPKSTIRKYVLPFAVTHTNYENLNITELKQKFDIQKKYFFSPNQFWVHKNHKIILEALKNLKDRNELDFQMIFSGKEYDHRNPNYFNSLVQFVRENNLNDDIRFLGFIDRNEQLCIMKNAEAIVQPSLFEGWSTVNEDAKSMNQCIVASNISVNLEQLKESSFYFDPYNSLQLSDILKKISSGEKKFYTESYTKNINNFGKTFLQIIRTL